MAEESERRTKGRGPGFLLGVAVGSLAGAAAAAIFAPPSEEELDEGPDALSAPEPPRVPPHLAASPEEASVERVRAMIHNVRARVREAQAAGRKARLDSERSLNARYAELTQQRQRSP